MRPLPDLEPMRHSARGSDSLIATLEACAARAQAAPLSFGEVFESVGEAAYSFIAIVLTLPFIQPISLGPLSTIGGLTFAALGWQLYRGHHAPLLPERVKRTVPGPKTWDTLISACLKILGWCRKISRPRYQSWVSGRKGQKVAGMTLITAGLLMAIPFFGIPFNNTLPALAIFFICVGELEQDGMMVFIAFGWLIVTVIYFVFILVLLWILGEQALSYFQLRGL
jgi:hypothetical protein